MNLTARRPGERGLTVARHRLRLTENRPTVPQAVPLAGFEVERQGSGCRCPRCPRGYGPGRGPGNPSRVNSLGPCQTILGHASTPAGATAPRDLDVDRKLHWVGAIATFSPSGMSLNGPASVYHEALLAELVSGRHERLGDAVLAAQVAYANNGALPELLSLYHLFGDLVLVIQ